MSEDFRERLDRLDRMANAAPQGLLDHRATLDLRACLVRPGAQAGRAILAPQVRQVPQAPQVSVVFRALPALSVRPDQQAQRAPLVRRG